MAALPATKSRPAAGLHGLPPIGPAWRDVSNKYTGQRGAEDSL
ncbi:MAG: hypothetical protein U1F53_05250 [Burkholderiaceae bacterium]